MDTENKEMEKKQQAEEEVDIMAILKKFWDKRKFILKVTAVFFVLGLFIALFSPKEFTVSSVFVPQTGKSTSSSSRLSGLAAMAGISLDMGGSDATLSPMVYPHLLKNVDFQKELMQTKIHFEGIAEPVSLYDYFTDKKYQKTNVLGAIKKYTIGLPGVIAGAGRNDDEKQVKGAASGLEDLNSLSMKESRVAATLGSRISLSVDQKQGYLTLTTTMDEAVAATELNNSVYALLKKYVSSYKTAKSQSDLEFVESQCEEAKADYEQKQRTYAYYIDSHKGYATASAAVESERLAADLELSRQLYNELAKNVMTSKIKVKEETVTFSDLTPASVPVKKTKPKRMSIVLIWTFLGICAGCGWIFLKDWWKGQKAKADQHQEQ